MVIVSPKILYPSNKYDILQKFYIISLAQAFTSRLIFKLLKDDEN